MATLKSWWSNKYGLPSNHRLFLGQSHAELNLEYYEELLMKKEAIENTIKDGVIDSKEHSSMLRKLAEINKELNNGEDELTSDPVIDEWERKLEAGEEIDLNEGLASGK